MASGADEPWVTTTPLRVGPRSTGRQHEALKSVGTALDVLECFAVDGELGVSDIARRLDIAKSTAHRLLTTLASRGMVSQNPENGLYRLGMHLYELGQLALARHTLRHIALPILQELRRATRFTVNFSVADGADIVFVERLLTAQSGPVLSHSGYRYPAHCTSSGKAIAAFNPPLAQARLAAGFPPRAKGTVRSAADWSAAIEHVRRKGYAESHDESFDGVSSVAVPVLDGSGTAVAAVSVFGSSHDLDPEIERLVPLLVAASRRISKRL